MDSESADMVTSIDDNMVRIVIGGWWLAFVQIFSGFHVNVSFPLVLAKAVFFTSNC